MSGISNESFENEESSFSYKAEDASNINIQQAAVIVYESEEHYPKSREVYGEKHTVLSKTPNADILCYNNNNGTMSNSIIQLSEVYDDKHLEESFQVQRSKNLTISYEYLAWFSFCAVTILCIVDRFVMTGDVVFNRKGKRVDRLWGTNLGEAITNILWAVTARLIITSQNMMFYTALWCIPNIISEFAPTFIRITGMRDIHMKMHRIIGVFLIGIPSLAHVMAIFIPPIIDRTQLTYSPPCDFNYSNQWGHMNWTKIWDPAAVENWTFNDAHGIHLTSDEIYRFTLMFALFCFLFPLSRSSYLNERSYSVAIGIHSIAGLLFAIDNIRKITHSLAHIFNLPFLLFWCLDSLLSIVFYRQSRATIVTKEIISSHHYVKVKLKLNKSFQKGVGDVYYLLQDGERKRLLNLERSHPFTSFSNHSEDKSWDIGFIICVMNDEFQWFPPWTRRLCNVNVLHEPLQFRSWGPYRSSLWCLYQQLKHKKIPSCILFASGSGFGYLLDVLGILAHKLVKAEDKDIPRVAIHYTVRTMAFYYHFIHDVECFLTMIEAKQTAYVNFNWYVTEEKQKTEIVPQDVLSISTRNSVLKTKRINFHDIIANTSRSTYVYFVGRPSLADHIAKICSKFNITLIKDFTNSNRGLSDKKLMTFYFKKTIYVIACTVGFCIMLSIYIVIGKLNKVANVHK